MEEESEDESYEASLETETETSSEEESEGEIDSTEIHQLLEENQVDLDVFVKGTVEGSLVEESDELRKKQSSSKSKTTETENIPTFGTIIPKVVRSDLINIGSPMKETPNTEAIAKENKHGTKQGTNPRQDEIPRKRSKLE